MASGDADAVLRELLTAKTTSHVDALLGKHLETALTAFPAWRTVPEALRGDQALLARYAQTLIYVAQRLNAAGYPGPLQSLVGNVADNPIARWQEALARQNALAGAGRTTESIEVLRTLIAEIDQLSGTAVEEIRPKALGALGARYNEAGDLGLALDWTRRALAACRDSGDTAEVEIYRENSQNIEARHLPTVDPEAGARLLRCRHLITSAQVASDRFDYEGSNEALEEALVLAAADEGLRSGYAGKIHGLRGWNHYHLGELAAARTHTERALAECRAADDPAGIRVYAANLEYLARPSGIRLSGPASLRVRAGWPWRP